MNYPIAITLAAFGLVLWGYLRRDAEARRRYLAVGLHERLAFAALVAAIAWQVLA